MLLIMGIDTLNNWYNVCIILRRSQAHGLAVLFRFVLYSTFFHFFSAAFRYGHFLTEYKPKTTYYEKELLHCFENL